MKRLRDYLELSFEEIYTVDRPTLGRNADVSLIRALILSIIRYLGFNAASKLYHAGMYFGGELGVSSIDDMKEIFKELGIGIINIVSTEPMVIRIEECVECSGLPNIGKPVCYFDAGVIAGCLEGILGSEVKVVEKNAVLWGMTIANLRYIHYQIKYCKIIL
ncbi:V4R domain-containing protein [Methanothermococcus okinawensis]|uniref:4-vinyl reductase 4VR n=1 Tax=Methanothermococcus okinawensis (strain DSM 14208 / JCM 11175 / IH1) TaxID=647113 RepID=F8AKR0_METOI|nr:V4R domain-containing protein [Methanothermococcus okinawensis]AEH06398.1 4-vinyl reductase 4VR [Methanothermococcus okinawensis IH1]